MKWWPFAMTSTVRLLEVKLEMSDSQLAYWRTRAEELIDADMVRRGAIHQPTMVQRPTSTVVSMLEQISGSMALTEIDSTAKRKAATS